MSIKNLLQYFFIIICSFFVVGIFVVGIANAQLEFIMDGYEDKFFKSDEGPGAEIKSDEKEDANSQYIYEVPTIKALSHMYWALNLYRTADNEAVDEFMQINECDIFKKFGGDELEWHDIREAAKVFLKSNKNEFPTRFVFILPLKLYDYSTRRQSFEVQEKYKVISARRFELFADDYNSPRCYVNESKSLGYPRVINLEFSRPFNLTHVPMTQRMANSYIKETTKEYHKWYKKIDRKKEFMYGYRRAFLALRVKIFARGDFLRLNDYGFPVVQMMGMIESYAIYKDKGLTKLLFKQSYISNKKRGKLNVRLKDQYEILRQRSKDGGILSY